MGGRPMSAVEYRTAFAAKGGLLFLRDAPGIALGDRVVVADRAGRRRSGQVIASGRDTVLVQVLEGTDELNLESTWVRFLDAPFALPVSRELLGRVFSGTGAPRDGRPPLLAGSLRPVHGAPLNPAARAYPSEFIETGVSAIDGL
ncbi:MAG: V-type ATP synthase subunit B, partial [Gallionellaceae bacterium]|nr:V-type ATP synthase subunit B [Gallionellaceae bacterium]